MLQREEDSLLVIGSDSVCPMVINEMKSEMLKVSAAVLLTMCALSGI